MIIDMRCFHFGHFVSELLYILLQMGHDLVALGSFVLHDDAAVITRCVARRVADQRLS